MNTVVVTMLLTVTAPKEMDPNLFAAAARNAILALLPRPENGDVAKHPFEADVSFISMRTKE